MTTKAFVLLSGGMDSTTCLYLAAARFGAQNTVAFGIDYGQIHKREQDYARVSCHHLGVSFNTLPLSLQPSSALTDQERNQSIPDKAYSELPEGVSPSYHWFRNGQMLAVVAAWAHANIGESNKGVILAGQHAEDAENWAYPDCTFEFLGAMANAIYIGTYHQVRLETPLVFLHKKDIVKLGQELGVNWQDTYSCYHGGEYHCGKCPTCKSRKQAFIDAHVQDPTTYQGEFEGD